MGIREFITRVVPWPTASEPGFINLHWTTHREKGGMPGRPFTDPDEFVKMTSWAMTHEKWVKDIYFCLSRQSDTGNLNKNGKLLALRRKENAVALKAIWLDIDVKPDAYPTIEDAISALNAFVIAAGYPMPSALVGSGGGLHVYWTSNRPMTPDEWRPYAEGLKGAAMKHGLKCDYGLTTDEARVLRVPGTFNKKTQPARQVKLLHLGEDYDFAGRHFPTADIYPGRVHTAPLSREAVAKPQIAAALADLPEVDISGIGYDDHPLDWGPLVSHCAFFRDALQTGGEHYSQPMWNLTTLMATFLEDGHALAHKMGNRHAGYSPGSTDDLWDRKTKEREDRGLGWPSCKAIHANGCKACETCPHFGAIKSPLSLCLGASTVPESEQVHDGRPAGSVSQGDNGSGNGGSGSVQQAPAPAPAALPPQISGAIENKDLPYGYAINRSTGWVCKLGKAEGKKEPSLSTMMQTRIYNPWAERDPHRLHFTVDMSLGLTQQITIWQKDMANSVTAAKALAAEGVKFRPSASGLIGDFLMDFLTKLHNEQKASHAVPYGWLTEDGQDIGFAYASKLFTKEGDSWCGIADDVLQQKYTPTGDVKVWLEALQLVTSQNKPELEILVAAAFAAPLMHFAAPDANSTLTAYGQPGGNKSTAVELGLAVWGHPTATKQKPIASKKGMLKVMGELRNLPLYWDDIRDEHMEKAAGTVSDFSQMGDGHFLDSSRRLQGGSYEWASLLTVTTNSCLGDYMVSQYKSNPATLYRLFELEIEPSVQSDPVVQNRATDLRARLASNYGGMGLIYAKVLASAPEGVQEVLNAVRDNFATKVKARREERFWTLFCAAIIVGSRIANQLGANFHLQAIEDCLGAWYQHQRERIVEEQVLGGSEDHVFGVLNEFIKAHPGNTIRTEHYNVKSRGAPKDPGLISGPLRDKSPVIHIQWVRGHNLLRFSKKRFDEYCREQKQTLAQVRKGLRHFYGMTTEPKVNLAAGLSYDGTAAVSVHTIKFEDGSPLWEMANAYQAYEDPSVMTQLAAADQKQAIQTGQLAPAEGSTAGQTAS